VQGTGPTRPGSEGKGAEGPEHEVRTTVTTTQNHKASESLAYKDNFTFPPGEGRKTTSKNKNQLCQASRHYGPEKSDGHTQVGWARSGTESTGGKFGFLVGNSLTGVGVAIPPRKHLGDRANRRHGDRPSSTVSDHAIAEKKSLGIAKKAITGRRFLTGSAERGGASEERQGYHAPLNSYRRSKGNLHTAEPSCVERRVAYPSDLKTEEKYIKDSRVKTQIQKIIADSPRKKREHKYCGGKPGGTGVGG